MLATISYAIWNALNMQNITPNSKTWDYSDTPGSGHKNIKGPPHVVEGGHYLRKSPQPHPQDGREVVWSLSCEYLGLYSLSGKTSYCKIS